ncbi:MAG: DNA translocase FtsK [Clostridia bacterium]|nr:DNA translocase FtsK [Clostridia bacterium]
MATYKYKKTNTKSPAPQQNKKAAPKKNTKAQLASPPTKKQRKENNPNSIINQILPYVWGLLGFAICFCLIFTAHSGFIGMKIVKPVLCGLFGIGAFSVPVLIIIQAFLWKKDIETDTVFFKVLSSLFVLVSFSVALHTIFTPASTINPATLWTDGNSWKGGGVIGGFISSLFVMGIDKPLTLCIFIPLLLVFATFIFGLTPASAFAAIRGKICEGRDRFEEDTEKVWHSPKDKKKLTIDESALEPETTAAPVDMTAYDDALKEKERKKNLEAEENSDEPFNPDVPLDELAEDVNSTKKEFIFPFRKPKKAALENNQAATEENKKINLNDIFSEDNEDVDSASDDGSVPDAKELELMVERKQLKEEPIEEPKEIPPVKEYIFPPYALLNLETNVKNEDVSEEMRSTAIKLVETLRSFKVKTRIIDVSRGPSITRYELAPEEGVRVRAIENLVDDISLSLATTGIRIAPVPGKSAIGVEVPNKNVSIVYLKELLDNQQFRTAKSRVTVGLGMDVAGSPIYLDIAKMPHLLIAGATGMGKSVCINSMIVSLLYKATPDEVKLILIDPKKVELSIYNGLPHLLVPVVTDPKKAAGSLHWAVTEMDRRFELIEEVGVRDVASYNRITVDDPDKEFLPQIVIVIDELADLMMTSPKDVEESICRLAQKARAAGMHLVIGTQRPSVDVVTGLIKANVPSRIAFTMASQVDSRTIIDVAGAEKLIGRGDMLYAPVGFSKPARVQGAFVSESEIEKIIDFIKTNSGVSSYDASVIESIEKEAARCGDGKNGVGDEDGADDGDPLFRAAVELAIESGKISTSLLQRRLSVGYGRAAKLIDKMEQKGIVSAPEGQKPRTVLISRQEFMEMAFKQEA